MKIYVATSWKNTRYTEVLASLLLDDHEVYDWRKPARESYRREKAFMWDALLHDPTQTTPEQFTIALHSLDAQVQLHRDVDALVDADALILVLPCGKSAHTEFGYASALGKQTYVLTEPDTIEAELLYGLAVVVTPHLALIRDRLSEVVW